MCQQLVLFISVLLITFSSQAAPACNSADTMSRIYSSIGKFLCLDKFYHGTPKAKKNSETLDCSKLYLGLAIAPLATGAVASKAASIADNASYNKKKQNFADAATKAAKEAAYWKRFTRADSPSFKPFSDFSRAQYKQYMADELRFDYLAEAVGPDNKYSKKVAKIASKKVVLYGAGFLTGFGLALAAADLTVELFSPSMAACSTIDYMYMDTKDGCTPVTSIGPHTNRFLGMSAQEQDQLMKDHPSLCDHYTQLAEKLENDLEKTFPSPEFQVTSCGKNNEVTGAIIKYGVETFDLTQTGNTLSAKTNATHRANYELLQNNEGFGVDSISSVRVKMKSSTFSRVHTPSTVLENPESSTLTSQRELASGLQALLGFTTVKSHIGNQCSDYLVPQGEAAEATPPTNR